VFAFADLFALSDGAWELRRDRLAVIGNGSHDFDEVTKALLPTAHIAMNVRARLVGEPIDGMRDIFFSPDMAKIESWVFLCDIMGMRNIFWATDKTRIEPWTCLCDNPPFFARRTQRRTRRK
jgi:hypothetical protein